MIWILWIYGIWHGIRRDRKKRKKKKKASNETKTKLQKKNVRYQGKRRKWRFDSIWLLDKKAYIYECVKKKDK